MSGIVSVTFCGNCEHVIEKDIDRVYVDKSYNFHLYKSIMYKVVWVDTGISYYEPNEIINRRERIRRMLQFIIQGENADYIIITDADVIIPNVRKYALMLQNTQHDALYFCYPALIKDGFYIDTFCRGTNFVLRGTSKAKLFEILQSYDPQKYPIDVYIYERLYVIHATVPGTKHYIFGKPYTL